ncbi:MAG TPA: potassium-transporting ATPase subunit KdpA [Acidimicrobiia bacterium]|jgi:K+-transporting ATPase ATPase A chain|nr:potassium-transporting ATPase subunit KdpA [Acidimicrobiia bacterium]
MSGANWLEFLVFGVLIVISTPVLGNYMYKVYRGGPAPGDRVFRPIENAIYRVCRIDAEGEQRWSTYTIALLLFSLAGLLLSYAVLRFQAHLPLNPDHMKAVSPGLSFNTAVSFLTNTNWQSYSGELTMSHLSQMFALTIQQFLSAAVGMAVVVALIRALTRRVRTTLGSFWVDVTRSTVRILLPISFVFALVFVSQGAIQNFHASKTVQTLSVQTLTPKGAVVKTQGVPGGPVGSMVPIEALGDNGGGYFNANGAHPFQNPNPITNVLLYWLVVMIPFAFPWTFGRLVKSRGQGLVVLFSMVVLFVGGLVLIAPLEGAGNPKLPSGVSQAATATHPGGNLEGKDLHIGGVASASIGANSVTATSAGAQNSAHESFVPLGGSVPLVNIALGEVSPGGTGSGLYGKLVLVLLAVFIAGLMVGRTPEYLGKKIQGAEMKLVVVYLLAVPLVTLVFSAVAIVLDSAQHSLSASGPHGLTEMVYTYTSAANNNGSSFAGISANTQWYNTTLGMTMLIGRYFTIIPVMAIAGSLVRKQTARITAGTFRTDTPLFAGLLVAVTVVLVGLIYFPILALGPIVEHLAGHF